MIISDGDNQVGARARPPPGAPALRAAGDDLGDGGAYLAPGAELPGTHGGLDVDALASRKEVDDLKHELTKLRRRHEQERELEGGAMRAEIDSLKSMVQALSLRLAESENGMPRLS